MKALQIVESAYRCTVEEQDDPAIWIVHAMRGAEAELGVLLVGSAVSYAVAGQDASGLSFGGRRQTQPPDIARDVAALTAKGVPVYVLAEDAAERGLAQEHLIDGPELTARAELPMLLAGYDQVWHW